MNRLFGLLLCGLVLTSCREAERPPAQQPPARSDVRVGLQPALLWDETEISVPLFDRSQDTLVYTVGALLYDEETWAAMRWKDWDAVGPRLRHWALQLQFEQYAAVVGQSRWTYPRPFFWDRVPGAVRAAAFVNIAHYWAAHYRLDERMHDGTHWFAALAMIESFYDHRALNHGTRHSDVGLYQISAGRRRHLATQEPFGRFGDYAYYDPSISARAGGQVLLDCAASTRSMEQALMCYNVGGRRAREGAPIAVSYLSLLTNRYVRYFLKPEETSATWTHILQQAGCSDRLFLPDFEAQQAIGVQFTPQDP